ncbi:MAG: ABC transporter substrate-binding protein [Acetobacteraceae bacterium]|nr:ABC transporter substrate-binding protein [Acetobacteraceae bacterium]
MLRRMLSAGLAALLGAMALPAAAQTGGGTLRVYHRDNPPSASIHEEATISTAAAFMGVFNNLFIFDQSMERATTENLTPELATSWAWNDDQTRLTLRLREGVKWHDGKPFTSADVKCTWDTVTGRRNAGWRKSPRRGWYSNLQEVVTNGEHKVTFVLARPQPSFMSILASGFSVVYPCHVDGRAMRQAPIGTGPFRMAEFRPNATIRLVRNPDYWRPGRPYLDAIEYRIIRNRSTRNLAFVAGEFDMTFPYDLSPAVLREIREQQPRAECRMVPSNVATQLLINREQAPFDNADVRRAISLAVDRQALIDIMGEGQFVRSGILLPPPHGAWGLTPEDLADVPGYGRTVEENRAEARAIMQRLGYSADRPLRIKVFTRELPSYRDPAVIVIDHLKSIHIEATLEIQDTSIWYTTMGRRAFGLAVNQSGLGLDDPDTVFYEGFACGSERNYENYCNPEVTRRVDEQSATLDPARRRSLVREIDLLLQRDVARPMLYHGTAGTCWYPHVRGITVGVNSIYNHWRMEDVRLAPR